MENFTSLSETSFTSGGQQQSAGSAQSAFEAMLIVAVVVGMFGVGCGVEIKKLLEHIKKPTGALIGILCQFGK